MCTFFFNDTATTEIYTLSLHDALPISHSSSLGLQRWHESGLHLSSCQVAGRTRTTYLHWASLSPGFLRIPQQDRKSTRLNSSHANISYAVFCLKKKRLRHARELSSVTS